MNRPTALIAEDEPPLRRELRDALAALWPELEIIGEAEDGIQAIGALEKHAPDVIFLDIQMPGMTGVDVARVASGRCHVVFVTAYDQYAVSAFDQGAVDYVLKPFDPARLAVAIGRVRDRMKSAPADLDGLLRAFAEQRHSSRQYLRWITLTHGRTVRLITVDDVCYFQADNKYTVVVTKSAQSLINKTIRDLIDDLDPAVFTQIHRGTIVHLNAIAAVHRDLRGRLTVELKDRRERLQVSASFAHVFKRM
jgi:DNA-binding LytR/AlgR family response regulator